MVVGVLFGVQALYSTGMASLLLWVIGEYAKYTKHSQLTANFISCIGSTVCYPRRLLYLLSCVCQFAELTVCLLAIPVVCYTC